MQSFPKRRKSECKGRWLGRVAVLGLLSLLAGPSVAAEAKVVVSIQPVHSLVAGVMAGVGEPKLLLPATATPHSYSLRPSDAAALKEAAVVFWLGPGLETFLGKPLASLVEPDRIVTLSEDADLELLPARAAGLWHGDHGEAAHESPAQETLEPREESAAHPHEGVDPHVWLDPNIAARIVDYAAEILARADSANAERYQANAIDLRVRLGRLDRSLQERFEPVRHLPFVLFHDAFRYLERRYGLNAVGALSVSPDHPPGAKRLGELRRAIEQAGARCVFVEPQFEPRLVETLVAGTEVRIGKLDPLGAGIEPGPNAYFELMDGIARSLVACLDGTG